MTRPASRPLASCQSLVYSFPRDAMWRSWAASCLSCFFIPVPLARCAVRSSEGAAFPPSPSPPSPPRRCMCAGRRRLHAPGSAASNRYRSRAPKKGCPAVTVPVQPASDQTEIPGRIRGHRSSWTSCVLGAGPGRSRPPPPLSLPTDLPHQGNTCGADNSLYQKVTRYDVQSKGRQAMPGPGPG